MLFSQRNNLVSAAKQIERLQIRTWNAFDSLLGYFHRNCALSGNLNVYHSNSSVIFSFADKLGINVTGGNITLILGELKEFLGNASGIDVVFSFIEAHLEALSESFILPSGVAGVNITAVQEIAVNMYSRILKDENQPFILHNNQVVPIVDELELKEIDRAANTSHDTVKRHMEKAWLCFSDRKMPDYENSVKESISAVEAMCCIITGTAGAQATLGATLKKLKDSGIHIHGAMEKAFLSLYGYTSDESGIRHGGIDFVNVPIEDAKYMLVSCSTFINYLTEKWSQITELKT